MTLGIIGGFARLQRIAWWRDVRCELAVYGVVALQLGDLLNQKIKAFMQLRYRALQEAQLRVQ